MSLETFITKYLGKQITDNNGNFWGECVSFVKRYAQEVQGVPNADSALYVKGDLAKNLYLNPTPDTLKYYDKVNTPKRGDIVVYGNPGDNSYGDVAVYLGGRQVIGQLGFPLYYPIAIRDIGLPIGYLRRKEGNMEPFNEGDRVNVCTALYGSDTGAHKNEVNKPFKDAMYSIFESQHYEGESRTNEGDVVNINNSLGTTGAPKGVIWKKLWYDYASKNLPAKNYEKLDFEVYKKK